MTKTETIEHIATLIAWNNHNSQWHPYDRTLREIALIENNAYRTVASRLKLNRDDLNRLASLKWSQYNEAAIARGENPATQPTQEAA